jgi:protein arginine kinase activator
MLCQQCKQQPASVHMTKIINNKKTELHLCESCARQREDFITITPFSVNDLIAGFMDMGIAKPAYARPEPSKCAVCGMDYNQFKKIGRVGCQECYKYFGNELRPVIRKIQGSTAHSGKIPKRSGSDLARKRQIAQYKSELMRAIETEAFERAAELRDKIKELEQGNGNGRGSGQQGGI